MKQLYFLITMLVVMCSALVHATSLVYSMRVRRALSVRMLTQERKSVFTVSSVPIYVQRNRSIVRDDLPIAIDENRKMIGDVVNIRCVTQKHAWFELTTAIADEWFNGRGSLCTKGSRFGLDDIVLAFGYNMHANNNAQFVCYGIGGLPTSWKPSLNESYDTLVGTKLFSLGAGSEFSYSFIEDQSRSLIFLFQNRLLHFFTRSWQPILPPGGKIQPGNLIDLLFSFMYRFSANLIEIGYNPTFFNNSAVITGVQVIDVEPFVRHGEYVRYSHLFKDLFGKNNSFFAGAGFSASQSKRFDTRIYSVWATLGVVF